MPTDLPPDYKPQPAPDASGTPPLVPTPGGEDARDPMGTPRPAPNAGMPGPEGDVVDPSGLGDAPAAPGGIGVPQPAGTPSF